MILSRGSGHVGEREHRNRGTFGQLELHAARHLNGCRLGTFAVEETPQVGGEA